MHYLRITRDEWQEVYTAGRPSPKRPAWANALIATALGAVEDGRTTNTCLSDYEAEQIVESFDTKIPERPFPGLEHGSLSGKLYTLWDHVQHDIDLDRTHGCT